MTKPSEQELENLLTLYSRATPGQWKSYVEGRDHTSGSSFIMTEGEELEISGLNDSTQDFIALSHNIAPALVAEIRSLRKSRVELIRDGINRSMRLLADQELLDTSSLDYQPGSDLYESISQAIFLTIDIADKNNVS